MADLTRNEKRTQIIAYLRDPLCSPNSNRLIARFFKVTPGFVAKLRKVVEAESPALLRGTLQELPVSAIRTDGGTQIRVRLDMAVVREYRDDIRAGAVFPPVGVVYDGTDYWLWDGFHRIKAYVLADRKSIMADVRRGTLRDAILLAAGANAGHGLRRTPEDKEQAVKCLLDDPEWGGNSSNWIAKSCHVSNHFVDKVRGNPEVGATWNVPSCTYLGQDGKYRPATRPSTNGTTAHDEPSDDEAEPLPAQPARANARVSITLGGNPKEDCRRLLASYPPNKLFDLADAILNAMDADDRPSAEPAKPRKLGDAHRMILNALADGTPLNARQIMTVSLNYRGRIRELRQAGYEIKAIREKDGSRYYQFVRSPE